MNFTSNNSLQLGPFRPIPDSAEKVYVIGDIHGCARELGALLDMLIKILTPNDWVIFIGDYIDRGPESAGVVDMIIRFRTDHANIVTLKGNHEAMLLEFLSDERSVRSRYLTFGGQETFNSYQLTPQEIFEETNAALPAKHLKFYNSLELGVNVGNYLITHAGIKPSIPIHEQREQELLWIRQGFIDLPHPWPFTIVFGHTPVKDVFVELPYKIGIDTGLVYGNKLTCLELTEGIAHQIKLGSDKIKHHSVFK